MLPSLIIISSTPNRIANNCQEKELIKNEKKKQEIRKRRKQQSAE